MALSSHPTSCMIGAVRGRVPYHPTAMSVRYTEPTRANPMPPCLVLDVSCLMVSREG